MSKNENEMSKEEIALAIKKHGGDPSMTLGESLKKGDVLDQLAAEGKVKVAKQSGKTKTATPTLAPTPLATLKFHFGKPTPTNVPPPTVQKFLSAEEQEKQLEAKRQQRDAKTKDLEAFKERIGLLVPDLVVSIRAFKALAEEARELADNQQKNSVNQEMLAVILNQDDPEAKAIATKTVSAAFVLTCPRFRGPVEDVLDRLVNYDFLSKTDAQAVNGRIPEGVLRAYSTSYMLAKEYAGDLEAREIIRDLRNLVRETVHAGRERFQTANEELMAENTNPLTLEQLDCAIEGRDEGKTNGTFIFEIPDQTGRNVEGQPVFHKGGKILAVIGNNTLRFVRGIGGSQRIAQILAEAETFIYLNQLRDETVRLPEGMSREVRGRIYLLHKLARLGITNVKAALQRATEDEVRNAKKEAMEKAAAEARVAERETLLAEVSAEGIPVVFSEEFLLNGKPGAMFLDNLPNPWVRKDKGTMNGVGTVTVTEYEHPENAVAIRQEDGKIRVKCPARLGFLFQGAQEAAFPGDKFSGLEYPLDLMLRIMWGVTKQAKDEADRKAREEAKAPTTEAGIEAQ